MIDISKISNEKPYVKFKSLYENALSAGQPIVEAICISSFDEENREPDSRFVNLKYIINDEWIFFSNYLGPKAKQFDTCKSISAVFFWHQTNTQVRLKAKINKSKKEFSDLHFKKRETSKNILAITSSQSEKTNSYEDFKKKYEEASKKIKDAHKRPSYWGGYSFKPYYFEFWQGHDVRLNKREVYTLQENGWEKHFLQP